MDELFLSANDGAVADAILSRITGLLTGWLGPSSSGQPQTLFGLCHSILLLDGLGKLDLIPNDLKRAAGESILGRQRPDDAHFQEFEAGEHPSESLLSSLALQALDVLGFSPGHRPGAVPVDDVTRWLATLNWSQPVGAAEHSMLALMWLIRQVEDDSDPAASEQFRELLARLGQAQDPETGLWGTQHGASLEEAVSAAPMLLAFFEYIRCPVQRVRQMMDTVLLMFSDGRLPGEAGVNLGAAWLLSTYKLQYDYRGVEIAKALQKIEASIQLNEAAASGSASYDPSSPAGISETNWLNTLWRSLFTRAILAATRINHLAWRFQRRPALGYFSSAKLSEHERQKLPQWIKHPRARTAGVATPASVTIVIPVFNHGRYLPEAIESALAQSYAGVEVVVVDDGSTDEFTRLLFEDFPFARTRLFRQAKQGVAAARNRGIREAHGRYICCLDADDRLRSNYTEQAVAILETRPEVGFITGHMQMFDSLERRIEPTECALPAMLIENRALQPALFRRSAWEAVGGYCTTFSTSGIEDWDFWISLLGQGYQAVVLPEVIFDYRVLPESMSTRMHEPDTWAQLVRELVGQHPRLYEQYLVDVIGHAARRIADLQVWSNNRERARADWEHQARNWQTIAEQRRQWLETQKAWSQELESGKAWLEEQWHVWRAAAEEREQLITQLKARLDELEQAQSAAPKPDSEP